MRVCVVGGTGNISSSIVQLLIDKGHEVTLFNRGHRQANPKGARTLLGDRRDRQDFEKRIQAEKFDAGIDMICFDEEDALSSFQAFRDVSHFVMTSTVCTYGIHYDWFPTTEDHPLRPITDYGKKKAAADAVFLEAFYREGFPVTIIKPSTTYGPQQGMVRQIAWDFSWIDRVRKGKPILICGDGNAIHQHLHVDDAAKAFVGVLGSSRSHGQTYNLVRRGYTTWADYHRTAMKVLGKEVRLIGAPLDVLRRMSIPDFEICEEIFAHHVYYSAEKLSRDVPEFQPTISLEEGMTQVIEEMDRDDRVPDSDETSWEDAIINRLMEVYSVN
jgi:nucleoside-diphosphate-sugar epimerase